MVMGIAFCGPVVCTGTYAYPYHIKGASFCPFSYHQTLFTCCQCSRLCLPKIRLFITATIMAESKAPLCISIATISKRSLSSVFKAITRLFEKSPLTAELRPGHLYIGIYLRSNSKKRPDDKKFHVLLATVNPENPLMVKKYHARNYPVDGDSVSEQWTYEIEDQLFLALDWLPSCRFVSNSSASYLIMLTWLQLATLNGLTFITVSN